MHIGVDEILRTGVERGAVPGASAVVVGADGIIETGAAGERTIGSGDAMDVDTVGGLFSMTKAVTGVAAMQLVEQGRIDLDAPASDVCPDIGAQGVLAGFDGDGQPITRPATSPVTLRNLLTHTSGYVYEIWNADLLRWYESTGTPTVPSLLKDALRVPLAFDPGTTWQYGIGIDWVGLLIEEVTGQTLGEYFAEHVTGPIGMIDTRFAHTPAMFERVASIHARTPDGTLMPIELPAAENPEFEMGGGGLHGTMPDYARFIEMILRDGEIDGNRILQPETIDTMSQNHIGDLRVRPLVSAIPRQSNDAEFFPGEAKTWGLTFQINAQPGATGRPAGTLMWAGLANSYYWIDRTNRIGGCYLSQILPFADQQSLDLFYEIETATYRALAA